MGYNHLDLWNFIVDFFEDPEGEEEEQWSKELLKWWNEWVSFDHLRIYQFMSLIVESSLVPVPLPIVMAPKWLLANKMYRNGYMLLPLYMISFPMVLELLRARHRLPSIFVYAQIRFFPSIHLWALKLPKAIQRPDSIWSVPISTITLQLIVVLPEEHKLSTSIVYTW